MIRLRDKNGAIIDNDNVGFIELCDLDGNLACAVYEDSQKFAHIITSSSPESLRYSNIFNVQFSPIVNLPTELK